MAKLGKFKIPEQFMVGFIAGIFSGVLVWLASFIDPIAQQLINMILVGRTGVVTGTELGTKLVELLAGKIGLAGFLPELIVAGIGGGVLMLIGTWIYNQKWSPDAIPGFKPTPITKTALILFYASIAATLILTTIAIPAIPVILVLLVNSIVTAWFVVVVLGNQLGLV